MANPMRIEVVHGRPHAAGRAAVTAVPIAPVRRAAEPGDATGPANADRTVSSGGRWSRPVGSTA